MAKRIMQFRYYSDKDDKKNNQPLGVTKKDFSGVSNGYTIFDDYKTITQLGIQALPGTRFYLNNNSEGPIVIGSTGIYELELEGISSIEALRFETKSLNEIESNPNVGLIIDIVYEG